MTKKSSFCQLIFRLTSLASADKKELFLVIQNYALLSYLEWPLILNLFSFEEKDPRFTRLKPGLALRLLSKDYSI